MCCQFAELGKTTCGPTSRYMVEFPPFFSFDLLFVSCVQILTDEIIDEKLKQSPHPFGEEQGSILSPPLSVPIHYKLEDIFHLLKNNPKKEISNAAQDRYHQIQEMVILHDLNGVFHHTSAWVDAGTRPCPNELLRFAAHLVLFFSFLFPDLDLRAKCETVLSAYIQHLITEKKVCA
jgi:hypothetical protein